MRKYILTITGPSCGGKTTLLRDLVASGAFTPLVSYTTRPPRESEVDGSQEYRFVSEAEFSARLETKDYAQTVNFNGVSYGTRWSDLDTAFNQGKCPVRIVEPSGVNQFRRIGAHIAAEVIAVFVDQDIEVLMARWAERIHGLAGSIVDYDYLARRLIGTVLSESQWAEEAEYDFYYDLRYRQAPELIHSLLAVARGNLMPGQIRQIAPRIKDAA